MMKYSSPGVIYLKEKWNVKGSIHLIQPLLKITIMDNTVQSSYTAMTNMISCRNNTLKSEDPTYKHQLFHFKEILGLKC